MRNFLARTNRLIVLLSIVLALAIMLGGTVWGMNSSARHMPAVAPYSGNLDANLTWWIIRPIAEFFASSHLLVLSCAVLFLWLAIAMLITKLRELYLANPSLRITLEWPTRGNAG